MKTTALVFGAALAILTADGSSEFTLEDNNASLTVLENGKPVLVYNYLRVAAPAGVPEHFGRACYLHPVYGLDGEVMTQDFPTDHYHHRGLFWAWPECKVGDRRMDVWALGDVRQHHEKWTVREAGADKAEIGVQDCWAFDDAPDKPQVREEVTFTVLPADAAGRPIDLDLKLTNVTNEDVSFLGAKGKGYGGLCFRPDAKRAPFVFTTAKGVCPEDALSFDTPWADVSSKVKPDGPVSGAAIFQHPKNPGYPFSGWIFRHYGFLGASWPHEQVHVLKPGESFELRYRLFLHRGSAEEAKVAQRFQEYVSNVR
jgi:hypothetical protein